MRFEPQFRDIAHLGHVELLTPKLEESCRFFANILGMNQTYCCGDSVYFRAWGDYEACTLKLTAAKTSGLGHLAFRTSSEATLDVLAQGLQNSGVHGEWMDDVHHGEAFRCIGPDGHFVELYFETTKFEAPATLGTQFKNMPQRRMCQGVSPLRLDHVNILAARVESTREFFQHDLGMKLTERIILDSRTEAGAWLTATNKSYDIAITKDQTGGHGRLHHVTYFVESREDVLKAADLLVESGTFIETGPHKHAIGQTFFLYCYEPGGNRFEIASGGYAIFDPDWKPIVWTETERKRGQAWGLKTIESFHTYGTPPIENI